MTAAAVLAPPKPPHLLQLPTQLPPLFRASSGPSAFGRRSITPSHPFHPATPDPKRGGPLPYPLSVRADAGSIPRSTSAPAKSFNARPIDPSTLLRSFDLPRIEEPRSEDGKAAEIAYARFIANSTQTPLNQRLLDAAASKDDALFILLLKRHPELAKQENWATAPSGNHALHRAVGHEEHDNSDLVYAWLEAGGDITAKTKDDETALNIACKVGNYSCANMLFEWHRRNNIPLETPNKEGLTPLHFVLSYKHPQGPLPNMPYRHEGNEYVGLARELLIGIDNWGSSEWRELGAQMIEFMTDVNAPVARSYSPLHCVVAYEESLDHRDDFPLSDYVDLLIRKGADINRQTALEDGQETIFHMIARRNDRQLLNVLFKGEMLHGTETLSPPLITKEAVQWQLQNAEGKTALEVAQESGHDEIAADLRALGAV